MNTIENERDPLTAKIVEIMQIIDEIKSIAQKGMMTSNQAK
jgi:hypothetical protein